MTVHELVLIQHTGTRVDWGWGLDNGSNRCFLCGKGAESLLNGPTKEKAVAGAKIDLYLSAAPHESHSPRIRKGTAEELWEACDNPDDLEHLVEDYAGNQEWTDIFPAFETALLAEGMSETVWIYGRIEVTS